MITIAKLLRNPLFSTAEVVAGEQGLNKVVEWSHIIDVPNVADVVGEGNTLIITSGRGLPTEPKEQALLIEHLAEAGLAGMMISVNDKQTQKIPDMLIEAANKLDFPIIALPEKAKFVDISQTIHEETISRNYALLKHSDHIHQTLSQIVLEGGGLQDVADALVTLVRRSVTIEDPMLNVLAAADYGERDPARDDTLITGGTSADIREHLEKTGVLDRVQNNLQPVHIPPWPKLGMTKERIVAPIVVERKIYGYLWLIETDEPLDEADMMTIERAAIVAALTMLKEVSIRQTEARLQADIISQLLSSERHSPALEDKVKRLGLDMQRTQRVLLLRPPKSTLPSLRLVDKFVPIIREFTRHSIIQVQGHNLVLILPSEISPRKLCEALTNIMPDLRIGVGNTALDLDSIPQSFEQAHEALEIGLALFEEGSAHFFEDLGFLHWLYHLPPNTQDSNRYAERVKFLATEERAERAQLLRTLEVFLDCGGNAAETARVLQIHRNTLAYRLKQIETYCNMSLQDPEIRLNLQIAAKAFRLRNNNGLGPRESLESIESNEA